MKVQRMVVDHFNRKTVKAMAVSVIGFTGLIIAALAFLFAQDQAVLLNQISLELTQTPVGAVLTTVKTFF